MPLSPRGKGGDDILNSDRLPFSSFSSANCCFSSIVFFKRELSVQMTSLWIPFPYLCDLTRVNSLRLPRKSYRIGGLLLTKKGDFNAWSARLWRLERIQELCLNEISMLNSCAVSYIVGFSSAMKIYPAGFLKTLPPNRPLLLSHSQRVANIKTKNANNAVSLLLLSSSSLFPLLMWLLSLSSAKNLPFWAFFTQWLQISLGSFSKNRLEILSAKDSTPKESCSS